MTWPCVVFDMDDTLYPEHDYVRSGFRAVADHAAAHLGISAAEGLAELWALFVDGVRGSTFDRWLTQHGHTDAQMVAALVTVYREHVPQLTPFADVPAVLATLHQTARIGLISDGYLAVQQRKFAALGLAEHFDSVIFTDMWGRDHWKPAMRAYEETQRRLAVPPGQAVYVGDNPLKDFYGARACGWFTIQVQRPGSEYGYHVPPSPDHAPHVIVHDFQQLLATLQNHG
ncbi:MAG: HAD family hydrolase [Anaerolineae bacterium]|nr:HAD family hydrolase [Anaerolineae bacterium]